MARNVALITGVTGQDGAYLAEFPHGRGCEARGAKRRPAPFNTARVDHLYADPHEREARFFLYDGHRGDGDRGR